MKYIFTSATESYLPNARILARSVKKFLPEARFVLVFGDIEENTIDWDDEPFDEVLYTHKLGIPNFYSLATRYSVIEFCTAVKGYSASYLLNRDETTSIVYLDPDTELFDRMSSLYELLEVHDSVLSPHITDLNDSPEGIESHEIAALKHGTFNLGFFAVRDSRNGNAFLDWWSDRLLNYSDIDFDRGLFTDQKWANLAPYLFDGVHVLRDRAYNAATWNMNNRFVDRDTEGHWLLNDQRLQFYHFSGFGHGFGWADRELAMFRNGDLTREIWELYKEKYADEGGHGPKVDWHWGRYKNGIPISVSHRSSMKRMQRDGVSARWRSDSGFRLLHDAVMKDAG